MKLKCLKIAGFRGYDKEVTIDFGSSLTVLDGRNGVGKSTIFDAIEFALTGKLTKYRDAKAGRETVDDYIWCSFTSAPLSERFVRVYFNDNGNIIEIARTPVSGPAEEELAKLGSALVHEAYAPEGYLSQLCASSIIRDEHISELSLDLKDTERYALLRQAIGASDADYWIERGNRILSRCKQTSQEIRDEMAFANADLSSAPRRLDELRTGLAVDQVIDEARRRLKELIGSAASDDILPSLVRERCVNIEENLEQLRSLADEQQSIDNAALHRMQLAEERSKIEEELDFRSNKLAELPDAPLEESSNTLAEKARLVIEISQIGQRLHLLGGRCPLCSAEHTEASFEQGRAHAIEMAKRLDAAAAVSAEAEASRLAARTALTEAQHRRDINIVALKNIDAKISSYEKRLKAQGFEKDASGSELLEKVIQLETVLEDARRDLRIFATLEINAAFENARRAVAQAERRLVLVQTRAGHARRAELTASSLYDAARRAAIETTDLRVDRILPLMAELYRRLRPHPIWSNITYSIRGDLRKFLTLQVGDGLNPQFIFSSGQRRATGLAFLLSVNLSLAWNRWRSILMDDPVQHVDDFRTVNLAELVSQLVVDGRQVICAVEDAALADLLCRRVPVAQLGEGVRLTLGYRGDGSAGIIERSELQPLPRRVLAMSNAAEAS